MADTPLNPANTKNDLIIAAVQKNLIEKAVLASTLRDVSGFAVKGAASIDVPKVSNFVVTERALGSAGEAQALTDSVDNIPFNITPYVAWIHDKRNEYQSTVNWQIEAALRASAGLSKYVDDQVVSLIGTVAGLLHTATADIKADLLALREFVLSNGGDISKMFIAIAPNKESEMLQVQDFIRADFYGSANVRTGQIGVIYGMPVVISRLLGGTGKTDMAVYDMDGMGIGFQEGVQMSTQPDNAYGANGMRNAMDLVAGLGGLELGEQGAGATKSPLVACLALNV